MTRAGEGFEGDETVNSPEVFLSQRERLWIQVMRDMRFGKHGGPIDFDRKAAVGDVVLLQSAPDSIWEVSVLQEIKPHYYTKEDGTQAVGDYEYLLRAVGTDKECWWSNVGLLVYRESEYSGHRQLRQTPAQYKFEKQWRAEGRKADLHMVLQATVNFSDKMAVCHWRSRHGIMSDSDLPPAAVFENFTATTRADMRTAVAEAVRFYNDYLNRVKAEREAAQ